MAVTVDGVEFDPADLKRFNGKPLHYTLERRSGGKLALSAATSDAELVAARKIWSRLSPQEWPPQVPPPTEPWKPPGGGGITYPPGGGIYPPGQSSSPPPPPKHSGTVQMFSDINYEGDWFWLAVGFHYSDLRRVPRNHVLFFSSDWNDVISSISATFNPVTYYEHINFGGSSFTVPREELMPDLGMTGWNDRISSVINWVE